MSKEFFQYLLVALMGVMCSTAFAAGNATLTRSQWLKKIGDSVSDQAVLTETLKSISAEDRVEFSQRLYKAISRLPATPEEKAAAFVNAVVQCVNGAKGDSKKEVIAVAFSDIPIDYLPVLTEALAKRFNQELNKLSDSDFEQIAIDTLDIAAKRNAKTDEPSVRDTFAMLVFLRAARRSDPLQKKLIALLPDEHSRRVVADLIPGPLASGKYGDLLNAAGLEEKPIVVLSHWSGVGHTALYRLLSDLNANMSVAQAKLAEDGEETPDDGVRIEKPLSAIETTTGTGVFGGETSWSIHGSDYGIYRVSRPFRYGDRVPIWERPDGPHKPEGYQNQGTSILGRR